jgi:hypothetical protein
MHWFKSFIILIMLFLLVCISSAVISPFLDSPVTNVTVNAHTEVLGNNSYGVVAKMGPYGNTSSPVKVAYLVGVHPWEQYAHDAAVKAVQSKDKSLKYCYYIYQINVTGGIDTDYETGRMAGQILAGDYILPDIEKNDYQLVVDIHSNKGGKDSYDVGWFINVPYEDQRSNQIAQELLDKIPGLVTYNPPLSTSPYYVTIPIIRAGTPAIIYEAYEYDSSQTREDKAYHLLLAVDNLKIINRSLANLA